MKHRNPAWFRRSPWVPWMAMLCVMPGAAARADIYVTPQDNGTPYYSDAPVNRLSRRILSGPRWTHAARAAHAPQAPSGLTWHRVIEDAAARHGVDPALVKAVIAVESHFDPTLVSPKGAVGMMQLMPATASRYGVRNIWDATQNIDAGVRHLKALLDTYHGDMALALAAYNAGEGAVSIYHGQIPPYRETLRYVPRVLARYRQYRASGSDTGDDR